MNQIMNQIETKYGILKGISTVENYLNGQVKECILNEPNILPTKLGDLTPQFSNEGVRRKYIKSVSFYENGNLKSISLDNQEMIPTSIGMMPAELVTFHDNGNLKRLFPLNGKITGYWTEENEFELANEQEFKLSFVNFKKKIINILFYETGEIKSITLWPKEKIKLETKVGKFAAHIGISVYKTGNLKSCEPAFPTPVETPIGTITAYDVNASGINGDINSLLFNEDGSIKSLLTSTDSVEVVDTCNKSVILMPGLKPSLLNEGGMDILPMKIEFCEDKIIIDNGIEHVFEKEQYQFIVKANNLKLENQCGDCAGCTACG
jgi:hypothetical protein